MIKVGLIGCGYMGEMHLNCYKAMEEDVKVVAVADLRRERLDALAPAGANVYSEAAALIENENVDLVDVCLPTYLHEKYAIMAMEKGCNVFVEKPLCLSVDEANRLKDVQKKTGKQVQVGQVIRFWDEYVWLKKTVENGVYGKVISGLFRRLSPRPEWAWENWLHTPEKSQGMAFDLHIHDIDYIRYLMGEPEKIQSVCVEEAKGLAEYMMTSYIYKDAVINAEGCWNYPKDFRFSMSYCVKMEKATVYFDSGTGEFIVYPAEGGSFTPEIKKSFEGTSGSGNISSLGGYYNELHYFVSRLKNPDLPEIASLEDGARSVELALLGIEKSKE